MPNYTVNSTRYSMKTFYFIALVLFLVSCKKSNIIKVINQGVSGNTSSDVLQRIDTALRSKPNLVVLMIGTNDVSRSRPYSNYSSNLTYIIGRIKNSGAKVLLMSPPPRGVDVIATPDYFKNDRNDTIAAINDSLSKKLDCYYLNLNKAFKDAGTPNPTASSMIFNEANNKVKPDGIHLTQDGKMFIAATLSKFIKTNVTGGTYQVVVCIGDSLTAGGSNAYPAYLKVLLNQD